MIRDSYTTVSDLEPVMSTDMDSLDMDSFKRYLSTARDYRTEQKWLRMDEDEMLEFLGICRTVDGNRHLTAAGLLMFGKVSAIILRYPKFFLDYRESTGDNRWDIRIDSNTQALNVFSFIEDTLRRLSTVIGP